LGATARPTESSFRIPERAASKECPSHHLQLYAADPESLVSNVSDYLHEGLDRGEGVLLVATPERRFAIERKLTARGVSLTPALESGQLLFVDARELLSQLMPGGQLDWGRFERRVGATLNQTRTRKEGLPRRAYGEMVGLLWTAGDFAAAARLEEFWNRLLRESDFELFCAYPIDVFGAEFHTREVQAILQAHTHLISAGGDGAIHAAVTRAARDSFKWPKEISGTGTLSGVLPEGEAKILWLRENFPADADEILARAREHYGSERRFRALIENSSDAIALTDPEGRISYASPSTLRVLGYEPKGNQRQTMHGIHSPC